MFEKNDLNYPYLIFLIEDMYIVLLYSNLYK